jgi:hypothetical protein
MIGAPWIIAIAGAVADLPPSTPDLGKAGATCRANENGPSVFVEVNGLRDRAGMLKLELYPANDRDFLADDNLLIGTGKVFHRVEVRVPQTGPVRLCIRAPSAGTYALSLLHDRDANRRFGVSIGRPIAHVAQVSRGSCLRGRFREPRRSLHRRPLRRSCRRP